MKPVTMKHALAIFALAAAPAFASEREEPVQVNTEGLQRLVAKHVEQYAEQGMPALRRYLWGTFHIHRIWLDDVLKPKAEKIAENDTVAARKEYRVVTRSR